MAKILTPEENQTYMELFGQYRNAINESYAVMVKHGMDSAEFREIDAKAGALRAQMRKMLGETGHWMS